MRLCRNWKNQEDEKTKIRSTRLLTSSDNTCVFFDIIEEKIVVYKMV